MVSTLTSSSPMLLTLCSFPTCPSPKPCPPRLARGPCAFGRPRFVAGRTVGRTLRLSVLRGCTRFSVGGRNSCQTEQLPERRRGGGACVRDVKTGEWGGGLRRPPDVAMVPATNFGNLHDLPELGSLDWPPI